MNVHISDLEEYLQTKFDFIFDSHLRFQSISNHYGRPCICVNNMIIFMVFKVVFIYLSNAKQKCIILLNSSWTPPLLDVDVDFEVARLGPKFHHPKTTLALIVLNQIIVWSKNLDQDISFKWLNIAVEHLEVDFLELRNGHFYQVTEFPHFKQCHWISKWRQILIFMFVELKNQFLIFLQKCLTPKKTFLLLKWPFFGQPDNHIGWATSLAYTWVSSTY